MAKAEHVVRAAGTAEHQGRADRAVSAQDGGRLPAHDFPALIGEGAVSAAAQRRQRFGDFLSAQAQGKAFIMISSEIPELMGICDRIAVMCEGNYSGEVKREEFSQERIMTLASAITV